MRFAKVTPTYHSLASLVGRERLKDSLEQRSGALKLLVQAEWDRFVGVKAATECELVVSARRKSLTDDSSRAAVYEEMKIGGPLAPESEHGVKEVRDTLKRASPILASSSALAKLLAIGQRLPVAPTPSSNPSSTLEQKQNDSRVPWEYSNGASSSSTCRRFSARRWRR